MSARIAALAAVSALAMAATAGPAFATAGTLLELGASAGATGDNPPDSEFNSYPLIVKYLPGIQSLQTISAVAGNVFTVDIPPSVAVTTPLNAASGASGYADFFDVGATASAWASMDGYYSLLTNPTNPDSREIFDNPGGASANGSASVAWEWGFQLTDGAVPNGTPVTLRYLLDLHATAGAYPASCGPNADAIVTFDAPGVVTKLGVNTCPRYPDHAAVTVDAYVGEYIQLLDILQVDTNASVEGLSDYMTAGVDALDTSNFALDILTPGVSYIGDDGLVAPTSLPSELPEPSALVMLCCGLLGMIGVHRSAHPVHRISIAARRPPVTRRKKTRPRDRGSLRATACLGRLYRQRIICFLQKYAPCEDQANRRPLLNGHRFTVPVLRLFELAQTLYRVREERRFGRRHDRASASAARR